MDLGLSIAINTSSLAMLSAVMSGDTPDARGTACLETMINMLLSAEQVIMKQAVEGAVLGWPGVAMSAATTCLTAVRHDWSKDMPIEEALDLIADTLAMLEACVEGALHALAEGGDPRVGSAFKYMMALQGVARSKVTPRRGLSAA